MDDRSTLSPFHRGEREVQDQVGVREYSEHLGQRMIRDYLPGDHKAFLSALSFVVVGAVDGLGRPWASIVLGRPGFIEVPDAHTIRLDTRLIHGDPLKDALSEGADVGLLGIEYQTRVRSRLNGKVVKIDDRSITITVESAFGNCPQYIQARRLKLLPGIESIGEPRATMQFDRFDEHARKVITAADHFFIATSFSEDPGDKRHGADVSHRGGKPGFVRIEDEYSLSFPDFAGNNFFNTLGNIAANPRAGILFIDFEGGDLIYLTCTAEIVWDSEETRAFVGAERFVRLTLVEGVLVEQAVPIRWSFQDYSPSLGSTGSWEEVEAKLAEQKLGNEYRDYRVDRVERESDSITSFYLVPTNGQEIPCHVAGQFLPIEIQPNGVSEPIYRTYTISSAPNGEYYRLSIKREPAIRPGLPAGVSSNYFHDHVSRGSTIRALAPRGKFTLDDSSTRPVVLLSGGVGVTPLISMLEQMCADSDSCGCTRPVLFVHGAVNGNVHAFGDRVRNLAEKYSCVTTHIRYSDPIESDIEGETFDSTGHVDVELIKSLLSLDDYDFYLCGPTPFMESLYVGLKDLGVVDDRIHYEFFGTGTSLKSKSSTLSLVDVLGDQQPVAVQFARSGIETTWDPSKGTLLDLAESEGLQPAYSCRSGVCQSCSTRVSKGEVSYLEQPITDPGECDALICSAYPRSVADRGGDDSPLVLDL